MTDIKTWQTPRLEASMWHCGDDHCDCYQPVIERITPNTNAGIPWINRELLWQGESHSRPNMSEWDMMTEQLKRAAAEYGIPLDKYYYGIIPAALSAKV